MRHRSEGGGAYTTVTQDAAHALYRYSEHRGDRVRLDWDALDEEFAASQMDKPKKEV